MNQLFNNLDAQDMKEAFQRINNPLKQEDRLCSAYEMLDVPFLDEQSNEDSGHEYLFLQKIKDLNNNDNILASIQASLNQQSPETAEAEERAYSMKRIRYCQ